MPYPLLPFFVAQTSTPSGSGEHPIPDPEIDLTDGPHLSYAMQWFAFAIIALGGAGAWIGRRQRGTDDGEEA
jgi:surfeit locus 1 family protein